MKTNPVLGVLAALCVPAFADTFTVTTTNDSGPGSLREVMHAANANPGTDRIAFAIPGTNVHTIQPISALPAITNTVFVDGYSQPGSQWNTLTDGCNAILRVRLDGAALPGITPGLKLSGFGHVIRGLVIVRCTGAGILLENCTDSVITGNWIGLDVDNLASGNDFDGISITAGPGQTTRNVIGGRTPDARNVISANRVGISIFSASTFGNRIEGNFIGTDLTGTLPRGNVFNGVSIQSSANNVIGGQGIEARNVISANGIPSGSDGITLLGAHQTTVQRNFIGTDVSGTYDLGNGGDGIKVQGARLCQIGGSGSGNVIANNRGDGVLLFGSDTNNVVGNFIGVDPSGQRVLGNAGSGINVNGTGNVLGGTTASLANDIRFNGNAGIAITDGTRNLARGNILLGNREMGIDLGNPGANTNDVTAGDADTGANGLQNFPVITNALVGESGVQIAGYLDSAPSATFTLDFYAAPDPNLSGLPQAHAHLGSGVVNTGPNGLGAFSFILPILIPTNSVLTATASDTAQNTSELSVAVLATPVSIRPALSVSATANAGPRVISWPSGGVEFRLETASSLTPPVEWLPVTNGIQNNSSTKSLLIPPSSTETNQFYRLRWP